MSFGTNDIPRNENPLRIHGLFINEDTPTKHLVALAQDILDEIERRLEGKQNG